ncbi:hypothetical protein ECPA39_5699, partial [Escherichia coli PA39]
MAKNIPTMLVM